VSAMIRRRALLLFAAVSAFVAGVLWHFHLGRRRMPGRNDGRYSVTQRVAQFGTRVDARLRPEFQRAGLPYPPAEVALLTFKDVRAMEVYARGSANDAWTHVTDYPVLGASGKPGPKLSEGDRQVPEGVYQVELLNPNSRFHLSLRLNYPNDFDRRMGAADGRTNLGTDIMIHGSSSSIGCLAMGDDAAEDLFVLAARVSCERVRVLVAPTDFRANPAGVAVREPHWAPVLYANLREELKQFRRVV